MFDDQPTRLPAALVKLRERSADLDFTMSCDARTGAFLGSLAASRPGGRILELGTGIGEGTAWLLEGMDPAARLTTVELDGAFQAVAREVFAGDERVEFVTGDGGAWLAAAAGRGDRYDLVFADTWPGKFTHLDEALSLLAPGGIYLIDDLAPVDGWPAEHLASVEALLADLEQRPGLHTTRLAWSSGLLLAVRTVGPVD